MKRPMIDPRNDFNSTLFENRVSSLSLAQILGPAKVFCKILVQLKSFAKNLGRAEFMKLKVKSFHSPN